MRRVMVIAGTDSSGGAGLSRDTATAQAFGISVCPVVTAVTAQSDGALHQACAMPLDLVRAQMGAALATGQISAVKIGMLASADIVETVADVLSQRSVPIVLDPVLRTTSGGSLLDHGGVQSLLDVLLPQVWLATPNLEELAQLSGLTNAPIAAQAHRLQHQGRPAILVKGGHGTGQESVDHLFDAGQITPLRARRLARGKRGTGCTLATAIACGLAQGQPVKQACQAAKLHIQNWLLS